MIKSCENCAKSAACLATGACPDDLDYCCTLWEEKKGIEELQLEIKRLKMINDGLVRIINKEIENPGVYINSLLEDLEKG